jgi:hypothetical protein
MRSASIPFTRSTPTLFMLDTSTHNTHSASVALRALHARCVYALHALCVYALRLYPTRAIIRLYTP